MPDPHTRWCYPCRLLVKTMSSKDAHLYRDEVFSVVGILIVEKQTKESARRDKDRRPAIVWPPVSIVRPSTICFYYMGQNHMLVGVSLSAICFYYDIFVL